MKPRAVRLVLFLLLALHAAPLPDADAVVVPAPAPATGPGFTNNVTVLGLRPYNITGLADKDTANVYGDILFYLSAKLMLPQQCRTDPSYFECNSSTGTGRLLLQNEVYTQWEVLNNGSYVLAR